MYERGYVFGSDFSEFDVHGYIEVENPVRVLEAIISAEDLEVGFIEKGFEEFDYSIIFLCSRFGFDDEDIAVGYVFVFSGDE